LGYAYSWRLDVPVWTEDSDFTETTRLLPSLVLERSGKAPDADPDDYGGPRRLLLISYAIFDFSSGPPRWVVRDHRANSIPWEIGEDGRAAPSRSARAPAIPRTTAREAMAAALHILTEDIDRQTHLGLSKVGEILAEQLDRFTKAVQPKLKPRPREEGATTLRRPPPH
jgi:hypothetical protein